ncbi:MAG: hypothetical protein ACXVA9_07975 [Bdellovibrionales bacterium]
MKWTLALLFLLSLGCSHLTLSRTETSTRGGDVHVFELDSFLFSTLNFTKIPPETEICPSSRLEFIDLSMTGDDVLTAIVSLGLYVPHRVTITCSSALNGSH